MMNKMKALHITLGLMGAFLLLAGCDRMNDIQEKFASQEEQVYLGKVDSLKCYPGFGRAKITWYIGSDPKVENTIVYWNMRKDSLVIPFHRTTPGIQKDSIIVENLPEGSSLFEFRNTNTRGESSLYSSLTVSTWGSTFADGLQARSLRFKELSHEESLFKLVFSDCVEGDNVAYAEVQYTDVDGKDHTLRVRRDAAEVDLPNFPDGGAVKYRSVFFLPEGIDTVYNDFQTVNAPKVIHENGTQIAVGNGPASRYFDFKGSLCEWNSAGDLVYYAPDGNGSFAQSQVLSALVPRANFRDFFFYDDDKYIGITTQNKVDMYSLDIAAGTPSLAVVKVGFGSSFVFKEFIPARGFVYSVNKGELKTWFANNNGTWNTGTGTLISKGFVYTALTLYKFNSLLAVDTDGYLWEMPITTTGFIITKNKIGQGWNKFQRLVTVGDKLLALDADGKFWKFDFDVNRYWIIE